MQDANRDISQLKGSWRRLHNDDNTLCKHYYGDEMKRDGMDRACSTCGRDVKLIQPDMKRPLGGALGEDRSIILKWKLRCRV